MVRLDRIEARLLRVPLIRPYRLSFGALEYFETILIEMFDSDGRSGFGEATLLNGYTEETTDSAWRACVELADLLTDGVDVQVEARIERMGVASPFAATAFHTALDMLQKSELLALSAAARVPLLGLLNADDRQPTDVEFEGLLAQGYRTIKVKVGLPGFDDVARITKIQQVVDGRAKIRIDANQAFTGPEAAALLASIDPTDIELFEQPCHADDWAGHAVAMRASRVPLMLDESIYDVADIERAAALGGTAFVKVKAVKFISLGRLAAAIERIRALGMQPVLGNGVACDPGCWMEACIASRLISNAGEMNGYLKLRAPLLRNPPRLDQGDMVLEAGYAPELDRSAVAKHIVATHVSTRASKHFPS